MTDLNKGTRQRNLRQLSGSAAVPSGNTRSVSVANVVGGGGPPAPSTDWIQALGGRIGGWCIENGKLTADGGNVKLNSYVPSISLGAATDYITGTGFWVGKNSAVYKLHLGDPEANHLKWDGSTLTVVGTISATAGAIGGWTIGANSISADGGAAAIDSSVPKITLGLASNYMVGAGFFVGKSDGAYKFRIGDPEGNYVKWDGATGALTLNGTVTTNSLNPALQSFTTSIVFSSTDNDTVSWTAGTIRLASGVTYSITAGNTGNMTALTYIYLDTAVSTTALQTTTSYSSAVGDNRLLLAAAQNHASGASAITYTGQQPIINATDQITAQSIVAGNIAAGAVTADKISVTNLSAINANLGNITAGTITGGLIRTAASGARVQMDGTYLAGYDSDGVTKQFYLNASDGKAHAGGGNITLDSNGIQLNQSELNSWGAVRWFDASTEMSSIRAYTKTSLGIRKLILTQIGYGFEQEKGVVQLLGKNGSQTHSASLEVEGNLAGGVIRLSADATTISGGLNVGTESGAGPGEVKTSGNVSVGGTLTVGGTALGATYYPLANPTSVWNNTNVNVGTYTYNATNYGVPSGAVAIAVRALMSGASSQMGIRKQGGAFDDMLLIGTAGANQECDQGIVRLNANQFSVVVGVGWIYGWIDIVGYFK